MAGFLGFGNYAKPGKGVKKDGPKKKRFFQFFELYFRKFWKLIQLNLIYVLFCIPIITIGPATAAMTKIIHCYTEEKPVFLFSDFWDAFKGNFKQGLVIGIIDSILFFCVGIAIYFYYFKTYESPAYWILIGVALLFGLILVFANFYVYLMMSTVNLKIVHLIKNSFLLAFLGARTNFITLFFDLIVIFALVLLLPLPFPMITLLLVVHVTTTMISTFNSFQYVYKFMIHPYYYQNGLPDPYEEQEEDAEEPIFEDAT